MKVAYLTTYYNGAVDGRFGRFHDWIHTLRDMADPPFDFEVVALTASNHDGTLSSSPHAFLGEATDMWGSPYNDVEYVLNLPRMIHDLRQMDYDLVHVLRLDPKVYPVALAFADRSPVLGPNVQGYVPGREGERWNRSGLGGLRNAYEYHRGRALLRAADDPTMVALSQYHAENIRKFGDRGSVEVIPPGVDRCFSPSGESIDPTLPGDMSGSDQVITDSDGADERPTRFLYVGDFTAYKGYDLFLEALAGLQGAFAFEASVVGGGDPRRDRIAELGLDDVITVAGFVPRDELPAYYRWADCYVMPSVDENGPNTIVEALACGTPVVATDRPGINEYAPADASVYVERSTAALRRGLREIHEHRQRYIERARARVSQFSAERTVEALASLYERHFARTR